MLKIDHLHEYVETAMQVSLSRCGSLYCTLLIDADRQEWSCEEMHGSFEIIKEGFH